MKLNTLLFAAGLLSVASIGSAAAASSQISITTTNGTTSTVTPSGQNFAGTVLPLPQAILARQSQAAVNTGIGNVTSFHIDYKQTTGGKGCHYDAASYSNIGPTGIKSCIYTKAAQSNGSSYATCSATVTSFSSDPNNCSFAVTFSIK